MKIVLLQIWALNLLRKLCAEESLKIELLGKPKEYQESLIVLSAKKRVVGGTEKYKLVFTEDKKGRESLVIAPEKVRKIKSFIMLPRLKRVNAMKPVNRENPILCGVKYLAKCLYKICNPTEEQTQPLAPKSLESSASNPVDAQNCKDEILQTEIVNPESLEPSASNSFDAEEWQEEEIYPHPLSLSGGVMLAILEAYGDSKKILTFKMSEPYVPSLEISSDSLDSKKNAQALPLHVGLVNGNVHEFAFGYMFVDIKVQIPEDESKAKEADLKQRKKVANEVPSGRKHTKSRKLIEPVISEEETKAKEEALEGKETITREEGNAPDRKESTQPAVRKPVIKKPHRYRISFDFGKLMTQVPMKNFTLFTKPLEDMQISPNYIFDCKRVEHAKMPTIYMNIQVTDEGEKTMYELTSHEYIIRIPRKPGSGHPDECVLGIEGIRKNMWNTWVIGATFLKRYSVKMRRFGRFERVQFEITDAKEKKQDTASTLNGASSLAIKDKASTKDVASSLELRL
uniref:AlNc14C64G4582 protein n=1 Tax=Albugo laibachii Nc14 TaxID=890382 RepID=F0WD62_9STRA|nr:AlNc14C64G4582 [Albugo laibachii Nc14]|eukprot:CCA19134.1 AlNc14C64G4582 [Albugo laibachii Nc14]